MYKTLTNTMLTAALFSAMTVAQAEINLSDCVIQEVIPPKNMTAAFLKIDNETNEMVDINEAALPSITDKVELHEMKVVHDVMMMQEIPVYSLEPGTTEFSKGGDHLMLMNIEHKPQVGERHKLTLTLSNGEMPSCEATVLSVEEIMRKFNIGKEATQHSMTTEQMHMSNHHSMADMHEHQQADAMSAPHHSMDDMHEHHQADVDAMPAPHHAQGESSQ